MNLTEAQMDLIDDDVLLAASGEAAITAERVMKVGDGTVMRGIADFFANIFAWLQTDAGREFLAILSKILLALLAGLLVV